MREHINFNGKKIYKFHANSKKRYCLELNQCCGENLQRLLFDINKQLLILIFLSLYLLFKF